MKPIAGPEISVSKLSHAIGMGPVGHSVYDVDVRAPFLFSSRVCIGDFEEAAGT